ncbi:MAG: hypothetical protein KZQ85_01845 [Candidatus Thiodiazotropha sp. (ex Myrtea sp. 'scaly one' KF741663)]|nr:hypothetical protein [Candidatus Thiodiazotropha sp. (ex Myrtea sp. 'scaly one' KF741663)]
MIRLNKLFPLFVLMFYAINAYGEIEYYHCKKGVDSYWKFDLDRIQEVDPFNPPVLSRQAGEVMPRENVKHNNEWYVVPIYVSGMQVMYYINRKGGESLFRMDSGYPMSLGKCTDIVGDDLDELFRLRTFEDAEKDRQEIIGF